jgi:hypothetical protein
VAHFDDAGLLWDEPGDFLKVEHLIRKKDYGDLLTADGLPDILAWHLSGNNIPLGCNTSSKDGTRGMAGRVASGAAKYYGSLYLGRDAWAAQVVPFRRCAIAIAGRYQGREVNRIANHIEVTNLGWTKLDGKGPGFTIDPDREDMRESSGHLWQMLTLVQNSAVLEIGEAWRRWTKRAVDDCLRGHHDLDPDSTHSDPGPDFRPFLLGPLRAHLEVMEL